MRIAPLLSLRGFLGVLAARLNRPSYRALHTTLQRHRARLAEMQVALQRLKRQSAARHHRVLSPKVLRQVLPVRAEVLARRTADQAAQDREMRLREVSDSYRSAIDGSGSPTGVTSIRIEGLTWWVPSNEKAPERVAAAKRQGFPFRAFCQTREVAVGQVMLDVGANIGRTSIPRVMLGDVGACYAAEPDPDNYEALVRNVMAHGLRGYVLPDRVAIGAIDGEVELLKAKFIGGHRVLPASHGPVKKEVIIVRSQRLDTWIEQLRIDPLSIAFVKVDTQGWECQVLAGATELLGCRHIAWQLEVDPALLAHTAAHPRDLYGLLEARFTHFIDMHPEATGPRARPTADLATALAYLERDGHGKTDILVYSAAQG